MNITMLLHGFRQYCGVVWEVGGGGGGGGGEGSARITGI